MRAGRRREADLAATVARYEEAFARIIDTCGALAVGDLESRLPALAGGSPHESALLAAVREKINGVADIADAFVREAAASLTAAQDGRFHRRFLLRGMLGAFRNAAVTINTAQTSMSDAAEHSAAGVAERAVLTDRVREVSEQVAAASTELAASSGALAVSANSAVSRADTALQTVHSLERTSAEIQQAVALIKNVAAQTRLLALNATIEAARAGDAGRGFAVVASEVKTLADEVNRSSDDIAGQVAAAQQAAGQAVTAINEIAAVIHEMDRQVAGVAIAASGDLHSGEGGLSQMAEALRAEVHQFSGTGR